MKVLKSQRHVWTCSYTVEPPNKGFVPCREVVPISEEKY